MYPRGARFNAFSIAYLLPVDDQDCMALAPDISSAHVWIDKYIDLVPVSGCMNLTAYFIIAIPLREGPRRSRVEALFQRPAPIAK
jgi:hypothetical protein